MQLDRVASSSSPVVREPSPGVAAPRGVTETEHARAAMTDRTSRLLPNGLLDARIGKSTLAGALNDQIRFRVDRSGSDDPNAWKLAPDSPAAHAIAQTQAGVDLLRQLDVSMRSIRDMGATSNLKGFMLPRNTEAVRAGNVLATLDSAKYGSEERAVLGWLAAEGRTKDAGAAMRELSRSIEPSIARAGAWNSDGWITFLPDTARAMLVPAKAYAPAPTEPQLRKADSYATYVAGNTTHEVQHSVSAPSSTAYRGAAKWMEEGTANVFSRTPVFHSRNARAAGVTEASYRAGLESEPVFETGWDAWSRPKAPAPPTSDKGLDTARNYGRSQIVLRDLVRLAGADFRSNAGHERAFDLLQSKSMRFTPGLLAKGIIEHQGLDPSVYERLRGAIKTAVDEPGGMHELARRFGMTKLPSRWES